jgi:7-cyano-7-deazaguanine reductase
MSRRGRMLRHAPPDRKRNMSTRPSKTLDTFENPNPERDYTIHIDTPEFTCLCPMTGQPDFARIEIEYVPDRLCLELKALKLYFWSYRDEGAFHEAVTNQILSDLVDAIAPRFMRVNADFNVRGGVYTQVVAEHRADGWVAPEPVDLA